MVSLDYIAGFIDGEGCFSAHHAQKCSPSVTVVNTNKAILLEIADFLEMAYGLKPNVLSRYKRKDGHKDLWTLRLGAPLLRRMLPSLAPKLRVKRDQAEAMLKLIELIPPVSGPHGNVEGWKTRQELVDCICWLNQGQP